jgi:lipopolysaccharide export system permease protein
MSPLIHRYLSRELLQYWLLFTLVLWLVLVTARFSLYLGQAASGELPAGTVLYLLGLKSVAFFVFLLPLTLFLALLWLLGRLNRDFETLAMSASGIGPLRLYRAVAMPVLLAAVAVALLSLYLVPATARQGYQLRAESETRLEADDLAAGRFHSLRNGRWLLYAAGSGARAGELDDVFVHVQQSGRSQVLVARHAVVRQADAAAGRFLVLRDGYRYEGTPGAADYRVLRYAEYALRLGSRPVATERKWDAVDTAALWKDTRPAARAELQARLSRPLSVLVLALIAVPLGRFRPATSRFYPLWLGVPVFALYFNLLATAGLWVTRELLPRWLGLWWVHLLFLAAAVLALRPWRCWRRSTP